MRPALALLLLLAAGPADAFLFGKASDVKASVILAEMRAAHERGDCPAATALSETFLAQKPPAAMREEAYAYMGDCYERGGLTDKAISLYKLAIGLYPGNPRFSARLAGIYNNSGFYSDAVPLQLEVLRLRPDDVEANLGLARAYAALGFYGRAKTYFSRGVVLKEFSDPAALKEYAVCLLRKRDWDEALFIAGKGALAQPGSFYWPLTRARAQAGRGDYHKALPELEAAIKLQPSRQLRLERALYLLLGGLPRRAIAAAEPELAADPKDPLASAVKGMALYNLGEKGAAAVYFEAARAGGPFTAKVAASFLDKKPEAAVEACKN
ncbi:MAG: tetratricopeptide repeat protein [Elusimicrobiales bacterium]|nr:tetratricopeptide repeat protein [Elusimicrobiales bacterium]